MYRILSDEQLESVWSFRVGDWYDKVKPTQVWLECARCGVIPRCWRFDNGMYATCLCYDMYDDKPVRCESIMSVYTRTGSTEEYEPDNLRLTWNLFAKDGVERNKLENGKW